MHTCDVSIVWMKCSVLGRLVSLIYKRAHLEAEASALKRQAEQAGRELQRRLQEDADKEVEKCHIT